MKADLMRNLAVKGRKNMMKVQGLARIKEGLF